MLATTIVILRCTPGMCRPRFWTCISHIPTSGSLDPICGFVPTNGAFPPTDNKIVWSFPSQNIDRQEFFFRNGKMDSNKDKSGYGLHNGSRNGSLHEETILRSNVKVVQSKFVFGDELSIADDDRGGDPYNNTGAHCILKAKDIAGE